ncbi:hypothetical protein Tco_0515870 [Tanacetum coccineum]
MNKQPCPVIFARKRLTHDWITFDLAPSLLKLLSFLVVADSGVFGDVVGVGGDGVVGYGVAKVVEASGG